jgi:DNA polymerase-1
VLVASSDKDLYQLVTDRIGMIATGKDEPRIGPAGVLQRTGVQPGQVVEWLALTGDNVDNIPGVAGLGPKTAARLLAQFGSLAAMWGRLGEIESVRLREKLQESRNVVEKNLQLVRLRDDLDCVPGWGGLEFKPEQSGQMRPFYERMEFHSLVRKVDQGELF